MHRNRAGKPTQRPTARSGQQREAQGREHENNRLHSYPPPPPTELRDSPARPPVRRRLTRGFLPALLLAPLFSLLAPAALAQAPVAPAGLVATPGDRQVILTWNDPANSAITKYQYRVWDGRWFGWADIPNSDASTTSFTWTASANGTEYRLQIRAFAGSSASPASNTARATPYALTPVNNPPPLHDGPCIPWTYGTPRGYCTAKQNAGASTSVGSDLLLAGNPAAFIETESGEKDVHGRTILEIRETSCGTNTGSFRIRTLNWRFPGPPAVADPKVWVVATTGERWVSHGPGNERFRSAAPRMIAGGAKLRLDGEYGLPVPVAPHDGEGVVEVNFTVESDTNDSFEFQLLASRDANQKYNMLGWIGGGITGNTRRPVLAEDAAWGPTVHVEFIKNRNLSCPDAMSGSNSPPETQNTPPDAVIIGQGQPEVIAEGVPSDDESPYAAVLADAEKAVTETDKGEIHVDRWHRVLAALGVDNGHTPMPASEAQGYVDRGWTRWVPVAAALAEIESGTQPEPETQPTTETEPVRCVSDELKADVTGWSQETVSTNTELQSAYVERWLRVLQTFAGTANDSTIMLPAEARTYRDKGWARWIPVVAALECLEERATP